jgi:hypothetical protein
VIARRTRWLVASVACVALVIAAVLALRGLAHDHQQIVAGLERQMMQDGILIGSAVECRVAEDRVARIGQAEGRLILAQAHDNFDDIEPWLISGVKLGRAAANAGGDHHDCTNDLADFAALEQSRAQYLARQP